MTKYLVVGNGRLATHLIHYFHLLSVEHFHWHRPLSSNQFTLFHKNADTTLLCLPDQVIEPFCDENFLEPHKTIHFSGSLITKKALQFHPLMTFSQTRLYKDNSYKDIPFVGPKDQATLNQLMPELPNQYHEIDQNLMPLYHALCVLSGNGTIALWLETANKFESELGLPRDILRPYLQKTLENALEPQALTGPWVRNDFSTIERNESELNSHALRPLYHHLKTLIQRSPL